MFNALTAKNMYFFEYSNSSRKIKLCISRAKLTVFDFHALSLLIQNLTVLKFYTFKIYDLK